MWEISKFMALLTAASTKAFNVQWTASVAPEWLGVSAHVEVCSKWCLPPIYAILNSLVSDYTSANRYGRVYS